MTDNRELLQLPDNKSIDCFGRVPLRSLRQIWCFAQAGGGPWEFADWAEALRPDNLLCAVRLSGHERRFTEPLFTDMRDLARTMATQIGSLITDDAIFYGQCLGALIAFEVALELGRLGCPQPQHLFVASDPSPRYAKTAAAKKLASLDEESFRDEVREIGGLPERIDELKGLWDLAAPALRADFQLLGNYVPTADRIDIGITVLTGEDDDQLLQEEVTDWKTYSSVEFRSCTVPGGRFLTRSPRQEALDIVQNYAD